MKPSGLGPNELRDRGGEGNHIVTHFSFNFLNALQVEVRPFADGASCIFGNQSCCGEGLGGGDFYGEPSAKPVFFAPDASHVGTGIAGNHDGLLTRLSVRGTRDCKS